MARKPSQVESLTSSWPTAPTRHALFCSCHQHPSPAYCQHRLLRLRNAQVRRVNLLGDSTWLPSVVTDKFEPHGQHLTACELWAANQQGETTAQGKAEAILLVIP